MYSMTSETIDATAGRTQIHERVDKPSARYALSILLQFFLFAMTALYACQAIGNSYADFIQSCRIGTALSFISIILVLICNGGVAKPGAIIMYAFVAFQFGLLFLTNPHGIQSYVFSALPLDRLSLVIAVQKKLKRIKNLTIFSILH